MVRLRGKRQENILGVLEQEGLSLRNILSTEGL